MPDIRIDKLNLHADYYLAGRELSQKDRVALWDALLTYAFEGTEPKGLKGPAMGVFIALKGRVDSSIKGAESAKRVKDEEAPSKGPSKGRAKTPSQGPTGEPSKGPSQAPTEGPTEAPSQGPTDGRSGNPPYSTRVLEYKSTRGVDEEGVEGSYTPAPTLDDVRAYFGASCLKGDPEAFFDYYSGQGWLKSNHMPISDWKAVARSWGRKQVEIDAERASRGEPTADQAVFRPVKSDEEQLAELEAERRRRGWA